MISKISFNLNGKDVCVNVESKFRLIDVIRDNLRLTGTKEGCGKGECGACTILVNGQSVNSCLYPVYEVEGKTVITIEGLMEKGNQLSTIQQAFVDHGAIQCGFCSPGMIMSVKALLDKNHTPTDTEICEALAGNLCRCTGYTQIIEAVKSIEVKND